MAQQLTGTEHIKRELARSGFEISAQEIQERLARKGVDVTVGLIYNVKSVEKRAAEAAAAQAKVAEERAARAAEAAKPKPQPVAPVPVPVSDPAPAAVVAPTPAAETGAQKAAKTRAVNEKSLREYIREVLANGRPMSHEDIAAAVVRKGYKSDADTFNQHFAKKLRAMVEGGIIAKTGERQYALANVVPVAAPVAPVAVVPEVPEVPEVKPSVDMTALKDIATICRRVGGVENVQTYLDIIKEVSTVK